jgi:hypothetical protein
LLWSNRHVRFRWISWPTIWTVALLCVQAVILSQTVLVLVAGCWAIGQLPEETFDILLESIRESRLFLLHCLYGWL